MNIGEWIDEVESLPLDQRERIIKGIRELVLWEVFRKEFSGTGLFTLGIIIERSIKEE